jgi:hypothetical protein
MRIAEKSWNVIFLHHLIAVGADIRPSANPTLIMHLRVVLVDCRKMTINT